MSPNVGNFVHDLVEMAKAMETLPQVEADRDTFKAKLDDALITVQDRELTIARLKAEIETHLATIRRTEVERDNAEMMFLELDERTHKVLANVKNAMDQLDQAVTSLDPPKPQPAQAVSEAMAVSGSEPLRGVIGQSTPHWSEPVDIVAQGQSEPLPTPAPTAEPSATPNDAPSALAIPEDATSTGTVAAVDDVGYHNEPPVQDENGSWATWDAWCHRMNTRYGSANWPSRYATA